MKFAIVPTLFAACSAMKLQHSAPITTQEALDITGSMFSGVARSCISKEVEATARRHELTEPDKEGLHYTVNAYLDADQSVSQIINDLLHPYAHGEEGMTPEEEEAEFDAIIESIWTCVRAPR